jgi:hypothetical protein
VAFCLMPGAWHHKLVPVGHMYLDIAAINFSFQKKCIGLRQLGEDTDFFLVSKD